MSIARSDRPCSSCGDYHLLGEFEPGAPVAYIEHKRTRWNHVVQVGETGEVIERSQYGSPVYYRVQFADGQRENFDPCEIRSVQ